MRHIVSLQILPSSGQGEGSTGVGDGNGGV